MHVLSLLVTIGLFIITPCFAEPLPLEISSASASHDQRTGKPVLKLSLTGVSKQAIYYLSINNIGEKFDLRIDGKTVLSSFIREPLAGSIQVTGSDLTKERIDELVAELLKPGIQVEVDTSPK